MCTLHCFHYFYDVNFWLWWVLTEAVWLFIPIIDDYEMKNNYTFLTELLIYFHWCDKSHKQYDCSYSNRNKWKLIFFLVCTVTYCFFVIFIIKYRVSALQISCILKFYCYFFPNASLQCQLYSFSLLWHVK